MNNEPLDNWMERSGLSVEILPLEAAAQPHAQELLSANERRLLGRMSETRRRSWLGARWAIKRLGSRRTAGTALAQIETVCADTRPCCRLPDGRDFDVSASHDDRYVVAALSPASRRIGVDVEPIDRRCLRVAARYAPTIPATPEAATRFWSACEAAVKCSGLGLRRVLDAAIPRTTEWGMELGLDDGRRYEVHQLLYDDRIFSFAIAGSEAPSQKTAS